MIRKQLKKIAGENFTGNHAKLAGVNFGIILLMFLCSGVMLFFLPQEIPILHNGARDYLLPAALGVWLFPMTALIINLSFLRQNRLTKFNSVFFVIFLAVMMFFYISRI